VILFILNFRSLCFFKLRAAVDLGASASTGLSGGLESAKAKDEIQSICRGAEGNGQAEPKSKIFGRLASALWMVNARFTMVRQTAKWNVRSHIEYGAIRSATNSDDVQRNGRQ
jgi:hypothetical protein